MRKHKREHKRTGRGISFISRDGQSTGRIFSLREDSRDPVPLSTMLAILGALLCAASFANPARAETINVPCDSNALISAIEDANENDEADTLELADGCTYTLSSVYQEDGSLSANYAYWYGASGLPAIASEITVEGNGATIQRSTAGGTPNFRIFFVGADRSDPDTFEYASPGAGDLTLRNLTLRGGVGRGGDSIGGGGGAGMGGAIFNQGAISLDGVTITGAGVRGGNGGNASGNGPGAGIGRNAGSNSDATGGFGGGSRFGGGEGGQNSGGGGGFRAGDDGEDGVSNQGGAGGGPSTGLGGLGGANFNSGGAGGNGSGGGSPTGNGFSGGSGGDFGSGGGIGAGGGVGGGGGTRNSGNGIFDGAGGGFGGGGASAGSNGNGGDGGFGGGGGAAGTVSDPSRITIIGFGGFGGGRGSFVNAGQPGRGGGGAGMGGAIFNHQGELEITDSTLSGNVANGGPANIEAGQGLGAAIFNLNGAVQIDSSEIIDNQAATNGGALYNLGYMAADSGDPEGHEYTAQVTATNSTFTSSNGSSGSDIVSNAPERVSGNFDNTVTGAGDAVVNLDASSTVGSSEELGAGEIGSNDDSQPIVQNEIPDQTLTLGGEDFTTDLGNVFTDPDDDELSYSASSDDASVATASVDGSILSASPVGEGATNITVTADDGNGGTVDDVFEVTVEAPPNAAPVAEDLTFQTRSGQDVAVELSATDDDGDESTFEIQDGPQSGSLGEIGEVVCEGEEQTSCTAEVVYTPDDGFTREDSFTYTASDGTDESEEATVSISVTASEVALDPESVDFDAQRVGITSDPQTITATSSGDAPLSIESVGISGTDSDQFTVESEDCVSSSPVDPEDSCEISVTFTPDSVGGKGATLQIQTDAQGDPSTVSLTGEGEAGPQPPNNPNACTIKGTPGNDILRGTSGRDVICGLGGRDVIYGLGGNDVLKGGAGNDTLFGGPGNDKLVGGAGDDRLVGEAGNDRLLGGTGRDKLVGRAGNDRLVGGPGDDRLLGGTGRDTLVGGGGNDILTGGPGKDRLIGGPGKNRLVQ